MFMRMHSILIGAEIYDGKIMATLRKQQSSRDLRKNSIECCDLQLGEFTYEQPAVGDKYTFQHALPLGLRVQFDPACPWWPKALSNH
jgi:hypothetical protein